MTYQRPAITDQIKVSGSLGGRSRGRGRGRGNGKGNSRAS